VSSRDASADLYRRWLEELWNGDLEVAEEILADGFVGHWPRRPAMVRSREELVAVVQQTRGMFEDLRFEVELGPIVDGSLVAARWTGTQAGERLLSGHDILRVAGGRFAEYWVVAEDPT
jgi:hypothetical protein